ncbi:MAG: hypothetical protein ACREJ6_06550, partial [Candidatus Methylomirabilis sp.]
SDRLISTASANERSKLAADVISLAFGHVAASVLHLPRIPQITRAAVPRPNPGPAINKLRVS